MNIQALKSNILSGYLINKDEALKLCSIDNKLELCEVAGEIRDELAGHYFDTCSIINARSGRCSENCQWCAQSAVFKTDVEEYEMIDEETCMSMAQLNAGYGIDKFSFVTSGRALSDKNIDRICEYAVKIKQDISINLCASMGLLNKEQLARLKRAGITRYHCNLESSESYFSRLCSSHSTQDKIQTIRAAQEMGMDVCSGGIIGMGESMEDRIDMAFMLRELGVKSIPINILNPIAGTPLEGTPRLSNDEILTTVAIFRFIHPDADLRFAGGRILIQDLEEDAIKAGINSAIMGDMLTTPGAKIKEDLIKINKMGYNTKKI
ncbi:biotin synthase BioB [Odoribacter sp. OttesenSCG-928-J03]|nr:biotin synthase BioB [Odoribacter sp. OttesenSCG-928-J03]